MKKIFALILTFALAAGLFAGIPHPVFVEYDATLNGDPVYFEAYLGTDPGTVLTDLSVGCGILDEYSLVMVECGNFPEWEFADVLYIIAVYYVDLDYVYEWTQGILNYDNVQAFTGDDAVWYPGVPGGDVTLPGVFAQGWNLWSYNVDIGSRAVVDVFAPMTYLTKVKSITQSYDPALDPNFNTLITLVDGYGYWVQVSQEDVLDFTGSALPLTTVIALDAGWNLAAFLPQEAEAPDYAFASLIGDNLTKVKSITQSYDPALDPNFNTLEELSPGNGYWVQLTTAANFMYPDPPTGTRSVDTIEYIWTPVIYTNSTCAYASLEAEGQVGAFVNGECRGVTNINDGCVSLVINGTEAETATFKLYQNGQVTDLNTEITTAPGEDVFFEITGDTPAITQLKNAYPNPFNPVTTVAFELANAGKVNVSVYNIKGQKVTELINDNLDSGTHKLTWNAEGKASGVYFIRMHTGEITQNQKVILMK